MAIVWLYRLAIPLVGIGVRVVQQASGPGAEKVVHFSTATWDFLTAPAGLSDAELSALASADSGATLNVVTTFAEPFEVRRLQLSWALDGGGLASEDVRVCTFHILKLVAGVPSPDWVAGDFTASKNAVDAWWTAIKPWFPNNLQLTSLKYYREGPDLSPPQPPVFQETRTAVGLSVAVCLPPQVAMSVTERAGAKLNWGRFFLPAPAVSKTGPVDSLDTSGRWSAGIRADVGAACETLYEAHIAAGLVMVVYRAPLPVRQTAAERRANVEPGSIPARAGSAWTVTELAIDDVPDVIRSRRFDAPVLRTVQTITGS